VPFENRTTIRVLYYAVSAAGWLAFESVTGACEAEDVGVVHDAVDHRGRDGGVTENLTPEPEGEVARHD